MRRQRCFKCVLSFGVSKFTETKLKERLRCLLSKRAMLHLRVLRQRCAESCTERIKQLQVVQAVQVQVKREAALPGLAERQPS